MTGSASSGLGTDRGPSAPPATAVTPARIGLYALLTTIWGSSFFFTALALESFNPFLLVQLRLLLAVPLLGAVVLLARRRLPRSRRMWLHFAVLGLIGIALPFCLITWAQVWVSSSTAIVLSSTTPIFVFLFATLVTRSERFSAIRLLGIGVAFSGVVLLTSGASASSGGWVWPAVLVLASAVYGAANVYTRSFVSSVDPMVTALLQLGFGALWLVPVTTLTGSWHVDEPSPVAVLAVLELGLLAFGFAYVLFFFFIRTWGSTATSLNTYLQPVVGVLLGVLVLGERPTPTGWAALAVIACGVTLFGSTSLARLSRAARR